MATAELTEPQTEHGDDHHDHPEWLQHHFETAEQQFEAGKLGIWLFLAQEVLFFTGLFVAYAVYRMNHPEVFVGAAQYLNPTLGALNTVVLLASSLAIAWGVRCAQKNQQELLLWLHVFTLACAGLFMGVKVVEYSYKFDEGLYWAGAYEPQALPEVGLHTQLLTPFLWSLAIGGLTSVGGYFMYRLNSSFGALLATVGWGLVALVCGISVAAGMGVESSLLWLLTTITVAAVAGALMSIFLVAFRGDRKAWGAVSVGLGLCIVGMAAGIVIARGIQAGHNDHHGAAHHGEVAHAAGHHEDGAHAGEGHAEEGHADEAAHAEGEHVEGEHAEEHADGDHAEDHSGEPATEEPAAETPPEPSPAEKLAEADAAVAKIGVTQGNFFSIYFAMTGVHALHIFAGIAVIAWIIGRIARGDFSPEFYGPVEFVGLYWHLVDLVWIYLFPLLYLIR